MSDLIPIIDLFAGPGGLGEGFSSYTADESYPFKIAVSVEKDRSAHKTLSLRAFYRQFKQSHRELPSQYYDHLAGKLSLEDLFKEFPNEYAEVEREALCCELGNPDHKSQIDQQIQEAVGDKSEWVLIGGPPCQAYSLVGRARMENAEDYRKKRNHSFAEDHRHQLYKEYLRIIAMHSPAVFVMENVKGILSAKLNGERIFPQILADLRDPFAAGKEAGWANINPSQYRILSFVTGTEPTDSPDYLIRCERYGIPQNRHRVILLGIREDVYERIGGRLPPLVTQPKVCVDDVIGRLRPLRSGFSKHDDTLARWQEYFSTLKKKSWVTNLDPKVKAEVVAACAHLTTAMLERQHRRKGQYRAEFHGDWYQDSDLSFIPNHETRTHMDTDLDRYIFVAAYGKHHKTSPRLRDFPAELLPNHKNVVKDGTEQKFADRFKVQIGSQPASTVTCHISKDGHYFIHPDPSQCRSLTVREAARLQTFPDNYFFEGGRTQQYHQVGNAVPPLLASALAERVHNILMHTT